MTGLTSPAKEPHNKNITAPVPAAPKIEVAETVKGASGESMAPAPKVPKNYVDDYGGGPNAIRPGPSDLV